MQVAVDEAIWGVPSLFEGIGTIRKFAGRSLIPEDVRSEDALIVRSVTRVDERLLRDSRVQFVGTATSGTDHIDLNYLAARGIAFADAAGCNSRTVAEYVLAAMLLLAERGGFDLAGRVLGIIGVGRIGSIVAGWGASLGMKILRCDSPLQRAGVGGPYVSAAELVAKADVISLHVPLVREGPDRTTGMVDDRWLAGVKNGAIFINTSRGECVCEDALLDAMETGRLGPVVLDVWNGEPNINRRLVALAAIATPHIAGYSVEARERAALMIRDRLAEFLRMAIGSDDSTRAIRAGSASQRSATAGDRMIDISQAARDASAASHDRPLSQISQVLSKATGIADADRSLRDWITGGAAAEGFDKLRAACAARREFPACSIPGESIDDMSKSALQSWGFRVS